MLIKAKASKRLIIIEKYRVIISFLYSYLSRSFKTLYIKKIFLKLGSSILILNTL
jgi:hypothetical protein